MVAPGCRSDKNKALRETFEMISIIVPTLNESGNIRRCIECIKAEGDDSEIIVCDGGSSDKTVEIAKEYDGTTVIETSKGRGVQMNKGAEAATGDVLLFLHADTTLETGWRKSVIEALHKPQVSAGAFTLKIDNGAVRYRLIEFWVKLRCALFNLPYGDQCIFVRRSTFNRIGGYLDMPLMEDVEIVGRLRREGKIVILEKCALTSDRRWVRKGLIRAALSNQLVMLMYKLGFHPDILAKMYYGE